MTTSSELISINKYDLLYESRMTRTETVTESLLSTVIRLEKQIDSNFKWMLTIIAGPIYAGIVGALIGKAFHLI